MIAVNAAFGIDSSQPILQLGAMKALLFGKVIQDRTLSRQV
ncbi:hypothetical protein [Methylotenera sp.]|jgi:hypothetical protein|nr:hypothetical protein [Methylotenera sp.]